MIDHLPSDQDIRKAVANRINWGLAALKELIAVDSVAPFEKDCQIALERILISEGLDTRQVFLDEKLRDVDGFHDDGLPFDHRPNLIAFFGNKQAGRRSLILNAHIDTVEWKSQLEAWDDHPLSGCVKDGKIYGRGSVDDKGQIIMAAMAILALSDLQYTPPGEVIFQSVVGEEPSGNGTLALCADGFLADAAINLEATENHIHYGHRGVAAWRFVLQGNAKHGSIVDSTDNVIVEMGKLARMLNAQLDGWSATEDSVYGLPKINVGTVKGGTDVFTTPTFCQMECAVRYAPGTYEEIAKITETTIAAFEASLESKEMVFRHTMFLHHDASAIDPKSELVRVIHKCAQSVENDCQLLTFPGGADARHFINRYHIPTVLFGSGSLKLAHAVNECLPLAQWERGAIILAMLIRDWCT